MLNRPYTPLKGGLSNVWFDRFKISMDCPEHLESIDSMCQVLSGLVDEEVKTGIQKSRILIGEDFITLVMYFTFFQLYFLSCICNIVYKYVNIA